MAAPSTPQARRAILAAVIGNVLEWYDFAVYAYMATIIAKKFFPAQDEITSLLSTFAAFGVGFVVRPLGGIVIGRLGDVQRPQDGAAADDRAHGNRHRDDRLRAGLRNDRCRRAGADS